MIEGSEYVLRLCVSLFRRFLPPVEGSFGVFLDSESVVVGYSVLYCAPGYSTSALVSIARRGIPAPPSL